MSASPPSDPANATAAQRASGVELARGAVVNVAVLLAANLRAIFMLLVARVLGSAILGTFSLAWATMDLVSKLGTFGLDSAALPLVAAHDAAGDAAGVRAIWRRSLAWGVGLSGAVALLVATLLWWNDGLAGVVRADATPATALMLAALPGVALYRISNGVSRGLRIMRHDFYSRGLAETWVTIAGLGVAMALGLRAQAPVVAGIAGTAAGGAVAYLLVRACLRTRAIAAAATPPISHRALLAHAAPIAGYNLLNLLIMRLDVLVLGAFVGRAPGLDAASFGFYCAAVEIAGGMRKVRQVFDPIFAPVAAAHRARADHAALRASAGLVGRWVLAAQLPAIGVMALAAGPILMVFGRDFAAAAPWLALLGLAHGVASFGGLGETLLLLSRPRLNFLNSAAAVVLQVGLGLWLVPRHGIVGAVVALLASYSLMVVARYLELRWCEGFSWPLRSLTRPLAAFLLAAVPALLFRALGHGRPAELGSGLVLVVGYLVAWRYLGLDQADRAVWGDLRKRGGQSSP